MSGGLYIRQFLNQPGFYAGAHILVDLDENGHGTVRIADCNKVAVLEAYVRDDEGNECPNYRENAIFKYKRLKAAIHQVIKHLEATAPE